ncbi:NTP transferase domain-containing protein [Agromyces sp. PvR057]|uniref:molybdenum cofactor guanylyltransferase n=1 Tax=Agromyces sp. PvR057 TaxID=3156403 RepID=UPI003393F485
MTEPLTDRATDAATRPLDAVLLAGGRATRLGGASKPEQAVGGRTLLELAIDAARRAGARRIVVVGPSSLNAPGCLVVREDPPFGGPVAAIAAGLAALDEPAAAPPRRSRSDASRDSADPAPDVLVLACDLPRAPAAVERLLTGRWRHPAADGVCLVDADGRTQWLTAICSRASLDRALALLDGPADGAAMRQVMGRLDLAEVADHGTAADVDTWPDLERARVPTRLRADVRTARPAETETDPEEHP